MAAPQQQRGGGDASDPRSRVQVLAQAPPARGRRARAARAALGIGAGNSGDGDGGGGGGGGGDDSGVGSVYRGGLDSRGSRIGGYVRLKTIGRGSFGEAILVRRTGDHRLYVIKQIDMGRVTDKERSEAESEVRVLMTLQHPNVVTYHKHFTDSGMLNIVLEYADNGDLAQHIARAKKRGLRFKEDLVLYWFAQIACALHYVHSQNILHRDLKTQNIFLTKENIIKLGDFGIAKVLHSTGDMARTVIGTPYYMSPELCEDLPYNHKSDVWALGCVLYELTTLNHAFDGANMCALVLKILRGTYPPVPAEYSEELRSLIDSMLQAKPDDRPTVLEIIRTPVILRRIRQFERAEREKSRAHLGRVQDLSASSRRDSSGGGGGGSGGDGAGDGTGVADASGAVASEPSSASGAGGGEVRAAQAGPAGRSGNKRGAAGPSGPNTNGGLTPAATAHLRRHNPLRKPAAFSQHMAGGAPAKPKGPPLLAVTPHSGPSTATTAAATAPATPAVTAAGSHGTGDDSSGSASAPGGAPRHVVSTSRGSPPPPPPRRASSALSALFGRGPSVSGSGSGGGAAESGGDGGGGGGSQGDAPRGAVSQRVADVHERAMRLLEQHAKTRQRSVSDSASRIGAGPPPRFRPALQPRATTTDAAVGETAAGGSDTVAGGSVGAPAGGAGVAAGGGGRVGAAGGDVQGLLQRWAGKRQLRGSATPTGTGASGTPALHPAAPRHQRRTTAPALPLLHLHSRDSGGSDGARAPLDRASSGGHVVTDRWGTAEFDDDDSTSASSDGEAIHNDDALPAYHGGSFTAGSQAATHSSSGGMRPRRTSSGGGGGGGYYSDGSSVSGNSSVSGGLGAVATGASSDTPDARPVSWPRSQSHDSLHRAGDVRSRPAAQVQVQGQGQGQYTRAQHHRPLFLRRDSAVLRQHTRQYQQELMAGQHRPDTHGDGHAPAAGASPHPWQRESYAAGGSSASDVESDGYNSDGSDGSDGGAGSDSGADVAVATTFPAPPASDTTRPHVVTTGGGGRVGGDVDFWASVDQEMAKLSQALQADPGPFDRADTAAGSDGTPRGAVHGSSQRVSSLGDDDAGSVLAAAEDVYGDHSGHRAAPLDRSSLLPQASPTGQSRRGGSSTGSGHPGSAYGDAGGGGGGAGGNDDGDEDDDVFVVTLASDSSAARAGTATGGSAGRDSGVAGADDLRAPPSLHTDVAPTLLPGVQVRLLPPGTPAATRAAATLTNLQIALPRQLTEPVGDAPHSAPAAASRRGRGSDGASEGSVGDDDEVVVPTRAPPPPPPRDQHRRAMSAVPASFAASSASSRGSAQGGVPVARRRYDKHYRATSAQEGDHVRASLFATPLPMAHAEGDGEDEEEGGSSSGSDSDGPVSPLALVDTGASASASVAASVAAASSGLDLDSYASMALNAFSASLRAADAADRAEDSSSRGSSSGSDTGSEGGDSSDDGVGVGMFDAAFAQLYAREAAASRQEPQAQAQSQAQAQAQQAGSPSKARSGAARRRTSPGRRTARGRGGQSASRSPHTARRGKGSRRVGGGGGGARRGGRTGMGRRRHTTPVNRVTGTATPQPRPTNRASRALRKGNELPPSVRELAISSAAARREHRQQRAARAEQRRREAEEHERRARRLAKGPAQRVPLRDRVLRASGQSPPPSGSGGMAGTPRSSSLDMSGSGGGGGTGGGEHAPGQPSPNDATTASADVPVTVYVKPEFKALVPKHSAPPRASPPLNPEEPQTPQAPHAESGGGSDGAGVAVSTSDDAGAAPGRPAAAERVPSTGRASMSSVGSAGGRKKKKKSRRSSAEYMAKVELSLAAEHWQVAAHMRQVADLATAGGDGGDVGEVPTPGQAQATEHAGAADATPAAPRVAGRSVVLRTPDGGSVRHTTADHTAGSAATPSNQQRRAPPPPPPRPPPPPPRSASQLAGKAPQQQAGAGQAAPPPVPPAPTTVPRVTRGVGAIAPGSGVAPADAGSDAPGSTLSASTRSAGTMHGELREGTSTSTSTSGSPSKQFRGKGSSSNAHLLSRSGASAGADVSAQIRSLKQACIRDLGPVRFHRIYSTLRSIQRDDSSADAESMIDELTRALGQHQVASLHKVLRLLLYEAHDTGASAASGPAPATAVAAPAATAAAGPSA